MEEILIIHGGTGDAQRYRCLHLSEQLMLRGLPCRTAEFRHHSLDLIADCRTVILHRIPCDRYLRKLLENIRKNGGIALFDTDDLVFEPAAVSWVRSLVGTDKLRTVLYQDEVRRYREMMLAADGVLVSTDFLKDTVTALGKPAWVHRNAFSLEMLRFSNEALHNRTTNVRLNADKVVLGYASGTPTHNHDFAAIAPALQTTLRNYPHVELWIAGHLVLDQSWNEFSTRLRRLPFVAWQKLPTSLAQFDINLAPLELDNPFCQAKSEIKYVEAALVQVPTIASPTSAFQFAIRPGDNGLLASNHQAWVEGLARLIEDTAWRHQLAANARADVLQRYHPETRARELLEMLSAIHLKLKGCAYRPENLSSNHVVKNDLPAREPPAHPPALPSLPRRVWYSLRYRGLKLLVLQTLLYLRRRIRQER